VERRGARLRGCRAVAVAFLSIFAIFAAVSIVARTACHAPSQCVDHRGDGDYSGVVVHEQRDAA
jgi:hypothetical protein